MAAVMTVACGPASEEEVLPSPPPVQEAPIALSGSLSEEGDVTRTAPAGLETVLPEGYKKFKVWAYKNVASNPGYQTVMDGYTVKWVANTASTTTSNTHDWEYVNQQPFGSTEQTIKYWDWSATAYRFFAVAPSSSNTDLAVDIVETGGAYVAYATFHVDATTDAKIAGSPYYSKLWYSPIADQIPSAGEKPAPVTLAFIQPFAAVRFMFIFEDPAMAPTTKLTEKSFRPTLDGYIGQAGDVTVSYPITGAGSDAVESVSVDWSSVTTIDAFTEDYYESVDAQAHTPYLDANPAVLSKWYTVLPITNQGTYTLSVNVNDVQKTTVVPAEFMDWLPGYKYTYIFKVHVESGDISIDMVQAAFTPWTVGKEAEHKVYNW